MLRLLSLSIAVVLLSGIGSPRNQNATADELQRLADFEAAQIAGAKNGEHLRLQQLACELDFGSAVVQHSAMQKLGLVGGWFSINSLSRVLSDEPRFTGSSSDKYGTFAPLQYQALQALASAVPTPPLSRDHYIRLEDYSSELKTWREWLKKNRDSLTTLQPIGEGILRDEKVCGKVLKNDLANDAYPQGHPKRNLPGRPQ